MTMNTGHWTEAAAALQQAGRPYAVATVVATAGSTPRNPGSKIVVSAADTWDSIGGGQLEFLVVQRARELLATGAPGQEIKQFPLAAEAQQCCGGSVAVLLEVFVPQPQSLVIFGAGHVAQALVRILVETPLSIHWVDNRPGFFDTAPASANLQCHLLDDPADAIAELPWHSQVLVLTHDHALDYRLVQALLSESHWSFVGLIGSETKSKRFRHRLQREGLSEAQIAVLECPVGLPTVKGKLPMEVAVSIAAGVLSRLPEDNDSAHTRMSWPEMRTVLKAQENADASAAPGAAPSSLPTEDSH
ncbi:MAG: xanthine dehydrogenase accessory protein XdhC [Pseudomonadota bacterium]